MNKVCVTIVSAFIMLACTTSAFADEQLNIPKLPENTTEAPPTSVVPIVTTTPTIVPSTQTDKTWKEPATGMEFQPVKGGCYDMGDIFDERGKDTDEPVHKVCVSNFGMGKTEVTVGQFKTFVSETNYLTEAEQGDGCTTMDEEKGNVKGINWKNPGFAQTDAHPVVCISWNDATIFGEWLSKKSGKKVRLPTEAEWEYAARSGGKRDKYAWGNGDPQGNVWDEALNKIFPDIKYFKGYNDGFAFTSPVGSFKANDLGLFDMSGNVWEWTGDWYDTDYYKESPVENPRGPANGKLDDFIVHNKKVNAQRRVVRGGCFRSNPITTRNSNRCGDPPEIKDISLGFRLVVESPK